MIVINVDPSAFHVGSFGVRWYGIMYFVGIAIGLLVTWPYAKAKGFTLDQIESIAWWAIPAGAIGGRLYFVLQQPLGPYLAQPWLILDFRQGGMAFYGAIFAVIAVIIITAHRMKLSALKLLDAAALFGPVGQFFGRFGNLINGDIIGYPTTLPWGTVYTNPNSMAPSHTTAYQPASMYEALMDLLLFAVLWKLRNRFRPGTLAFLYVIGYSITQIVVFAWRDNEVLLWGLKQAQLTAIAVIIVAVPALYAFNKWQKRAATEQESFEAVESDR